MSCLGKVRERPSTGADQTVTFEWSWTRSCVPFTHTQKKHWDTLCMTLRDWTFSTPSHNIAKFLRPIALARVMGWQIVPFSDAASS